MEPILFEAEPMPRCESAEGFHEINAGILSKGALVYLAYLFMSRPGGSLTFSALYVNVQKSSRSNENLKNSRSKARPCTPHILKV